jgi:hypothetical protein
MTSEELAAMLLEQERWWSVKIQSFNSIEHFLRYAGRYARRPPIAERRIVKIEKDQTRPTGFFIQVDF